MRMSRATTLFHLLLGLRTSTSTSTSTALPTSLNKSPASALFAQCHATNLYNHPFQSPYKPSPLSKTYSTMSNQPSQIPEPQSDKLEKPDPVLALPDSSSSETHQQLDVNGDGVKLDHLGPLVVNTDGSLARIANWEQMAEIEKRNTLRVLGKRNKERLDRLKAKGREEQEQGQGEKKE
ncbi:hypothetical protein BDW62DRAFT_139891 [Aspergillus aurantiobrunneus]